MPFVGARGSLHVGGTFKHQFGQIDELKFGFTAFIQASEGQKILHEA